MLDLKIDSLHLNVESARGHEHRIEPIAVRAAALLAERLGERLAASEQLPDSRAIKALSGAHLSLNLSGMNDEQVAGKIADAWLDALALSLKR